jgi:hypothetical protein
VYFYRRIERKLTYILDLQFLTIVFAQVQFQCPSEQLEQHLKAYLGNGGIIPSFAEFVSNECICAVLRQFFVLSEYNSKCIVIRHTLSPCDLVEAEQDALLMQGLAD